MFPVFSVKINSQRTMGIHQSPGFHVRGLYAICIIKDELRMDAMQYIHVIQYVVYIIRATYVSL